MEVLKQQVSKFLYLFKKSKVLWIEIHNDERIDKIRPGTSGRLNNYNNMLKEVLKNNFVELNKIKDNSNFTSDGFHLNKKGQFLLSFNQVEIHFKQYLVLQQGATLVCSISS